MTKESMINVLRYKAEHIKTRIKPEFFSEVADALEQQPCEDKIIEWKKDFKEYVNSLSIPRDDYKGIMEYIDELPVTPKPKQKTGHWVLVSEGMPNEFADVICCTEAKEVFVATYLGKLNDGTDCFDDYDGMMWEGDIIAWMPLPEPFEPQKSEVQNADTN